MPQENVEIVRSAIEAFNEVGLAEAALTFFDPGAVFEEPPEQPSPTVVEGRDAAIEIFRQFDEAWEEHRSEPEEIRVIDDDRVLLLSVEHFRGRDEIEISQPGGSIFTLRDGKIVRLQSFWERETALEAAGLRE
jgi:ketosteroid isomerase-like protein